MSFEGVGADLPTAGAHGGASPGRAARSPRAGTPRECSRNGHDWDHKSGWVGYRLCAVCGAQQTPDGPPRQGSGSPVRRTPGAEARRVAASAAPGLPEYRWDARDLRWDEEQERFDALMEYERGAPRDKGYE